MSTLFRLVLRTVWMFEKIGILVDLVRKFGMHVNIRKNFLTKILAERSGHLFLVE